MKINRYIGAFNAAPVAKSLSLNTHANGAVSFSSDQAGARIDLVQAEDGSVLIAEVLSDGSAGESVTVSPNAPPPAEAPPMLETILSGAPKV
jgi:hypothetical protein